MHAAATVIDDLRGGLRLLRNSPGFAAAAIATLAIAIGANTAMFSFVNGLLLRPLPYPDSSRIVRVLERTPTGALNGISTLNYLDWAKQNDVFDLTAAEAGWTAVLTGAGQPAVIRGARASVQYFQIFGVKAAIGRTFLSGDDQPGRDRVVLLSHALWEARFGADRTLVGRNILLNGEPHTVVGILEKGGPFDRAAAQIWKPLAFSPSDMTREYRWLGVTARLAPDVTLEAARARMDLVADRLAAAYPQSNEGWGIAVDRLSDVVVSPQLHTAVMLLFAATLFVLLIGCANLANLALARGISRQNEMAVRAALGASRWRLMRQVLLEHVAIAVCGGIAGVGVGFAMLKWIQSLIPPSALPPAVEIAMDLRVLLFTFTAAVVTGVLFGVALAVQTPKTAMIGAARTSDGSAGGRVGRRVRGLLVVAEVAVAFVLLVASGLLMRSFVKLLDVDPGFDAADALTAELPITPEQHPNPTELNAYLASIRAAVEAVPGVRATALTSALPLQGWGFGVPYSIAGRELANPADRRPAFFKIVSPSYFSALRIKLLAGRVLSDEDVAGGRSVAVINETLAKREFPGENPIGRRIVAPQIVPGKTAFGPPIVWEVVGVVAGEKITGLDDETSAGMYVSNQQSPTYSLNLIVRTGTPPLALQKAVRSAIEKVNASQAISDVSTLQQIVDRSMVATRVTTTILAAFASIALLLAAVGIYGVIAYTAATRTHEMGIRAALGATSRRLRRLIFLGGMRLTSIGLLIGLAAVDGTTRVMSSMLYGVANDDPLTIVVVAAVLFAVACLACLLPAWRITKADPMEALRYH
ncbi:MAG TPA: ABC transporter permease [Vicinamibacterales bacterium]|nr:ABC transporter permease [Vicinamibacterales bacterium]